MAYTPQTWRDGAAGGTPITAGRLNTLEQGVAGLQSLDSDLMEIAALDSATPGVLATDGSGWLRKTYAQLRAALDLGNVNNTSDAEKPVSIAQAAADSLRVKSRGVDVRDYGALADGLSHPLKAGYATLAAAQAVYPHARSLDEELDLVAAQKAINTGARSVVYSGDLITNRLLTPRNVPGGQVHYGVAGASITNILPRNTNKFGAVSTNQTHSSVFELGNMHPAILNLTTPQYAWQVHDLSPVIIGDKTITVTNPAGVTRPLAAGDIVVIRSNNTPEVVGAAATYDFAMWNKVVSWNASTGVLVLELPIPVSIIASGSPTQLFGPKLCINDGYDDFRGSPWWVAQDITIRDLRLTGLSPLGVRAGAWRCKIRNLELDCQHLLSANALAMCDVENLRGYWTERHMEVKQFCHGTSFMNVRGTHKPDSQIPPKPGISIGEQSFDIDLDVEVVMGRDFTANARAFECYAPGVRGKVVIRHFGSGGHTEVWALKSTNHPARRPSAFLDLHVRSAAGLGQYGQIGNDQNLDGIVNDGDPHRVSLRLDQRSDGTPPGVSVNCVRGSGMEIVSTTGDANRVVVGPNAEVPEQAPVILGTIVGPATYAAGTSTFLGNFEMRGVKGGDRVAATIQSIVAPTSGFATSLHATTTVGAANSVAVYLRNHSGTDVVMPAGNIFFLYGVWQRMRM